MRGGMCDKLHLPNFEAVVGTAAVTIDSQLFVHNRDLYIQCPRYGVPVGVLP